MMYSVMLMHHEYMYSQTFLFLRSRVINYIHFGLFDVQAQQNNMKGCVHLAADKDLSFDDLSEAYDIESLDGFSFLNEDDGVKTRIVKPKLKSPVPVHYRHAQEMATKTPLEKGTGMYAFVSGNFIFGDYLEALFEQGIRVDELYICTLSLSEDNVDSLKNILLTRRCKKLNLIVSHYFYSHERERLIPYLYQELDHENIFQLAVAGIHCKIALIGEHDQGLHLVLHGSANMRSSANVEQMQLIEDEGLYAFNKRFLDNIITKYHTIDKRRKSLRGESLWQAAAENSME